MVDTPEHTTKCLRNGAVTCKLKVLSSFNVCSRGQYAASKAHHCANTNVASNAKKNETLNYWTTNNSTEPNLS
jgi:hypothetical protein